MEGMRGKCVLDRARSGAVCTGRAFRHAQVLQWTPGSDPEQSHGVYMGQEHSSSSAASSICVVPLGSSLLSPQWVQPALTTPLTQMPAGAQVRLLHATSCGLRFAAASI